MTTNLEIDFVITWVDMNDPQWAKTFSQYSETFDNTQNGVSEARFRDYGLLKYWFRGVEKNAPWVRKIHFVTCGQKPEWLDENHPKINLVNHSDFIPNEYLPTFNSNFIESYLHKIPGLSEYFVYFNDDFYITNNVPPTRFFQNGLPCDIAAFRSNLGTSQFGKMLKNNIQLINKHFDKKTVLKRDYDKWFATSYGKKSRLTKALKWYNKFTTIRTPHNAQPYLKSTFEDVWKHCSEELSQMSSRRFRDKNDYTPELFRTWQICSSNFTPYNTYNDTKMFPLFIKSKQAIETVKNKSYSLVCLNDNIHIKDYERIIQELEQAFASIFPNKSTFEK